MTQPLLRTRRQLPWEIKARILSEFSHKMMLSGYWEKFRLKVIEAAVRLYDLKCQRADQGIKPLHRLQSWVNILPKNPYLAKQGVLEKLILLKSKKDDFREN